MSKLLLCVVLSLSTVAAVCQTKIGQKAPAIEIGEVVTKGVTPDFYKGKYLVLDFWATWCAPCIATFPHLDSVSNSMKSDKVTFALLSYEDGAKLRRFFEKKKRYDIRAIKISDVKDTTAKGKYAMAGQTFKNFNIRAIPQTYIIDPQGVIRWSGHALELNKDMIEEVIAGSSADKIKGAATPLFTPAKVLKADSTLINDFRIKSAIVSQAALNSVLSYDKEVSVYYGGHSLPEIMATLFDLRKTQVEVKNILPEQIPYIRLEVTRKEGTTLDSLAAAVGESFKAFYHLDYHFVERNFVVYDVVLETPKKLLTNAAPFDPEDVHNGSGVGNGNTFATNYTFPRLVDLLSTGFSDLIFRLDSKHSALVKDKKFDFYFPSRDFNETAAYLKKHYGIVLIKKTVSLPVLIIDFKN